MPGNTTAALQRMLLRGWSHRQWLACLLWPLSVLYGIAVSLRRLFYRLEWFDIHRVDATVVVVGNAIAGGAGKTPTVIALVSHLRNHHPHIGIISRGYGRSGSECLEVFSDSDPAAVGDEPLLLCRTTNVPVFVARNRADAAKALLQRYPQTSVIVCDDGLQHLALYRDVEICVFDDRGRGNGWLLPAGPLREPWPRQNTASVGQREEHLLVLHTGQIPAFGGYTAHRALTPYALRKDGTQVLLNDLSLPGSKPLLALAGIGQPENFFSQLRALGLPLTQTIALPDHYAFNSIPRSLYEEYTVICTEKDAIKLWRLAPEALAVPLMLTVSRNFLDALDRCITEAATAKLSSTHGHKTT
jgi:tetraacyldisaccharide 4'-kinase